MYAKLLKKAGLSISDPANCRPISKLKTIRKMLKRQHLAMLVLNVASSFSLRFTVPHIQLDTVSSIQRRCRSWRSSKIRSRRWMPSVPSAFLSPSNFQSPLTPDTIPFWWEKEISKALSVEGSYLTDRTTFQNGWWRITTHGFNVVETLV